MTKAYEQELAYELELIKEVDRAATTSAGCQCGLLYTDTGNYLLGQKAQKCEKCGKPQLRLTFLGKDGVRVLTAEGEAGRYALAFFKSWPEGE
jgi:7-cyano-7-deazaguanine synthase in queuosine biosynthesis